MKPKVRPGTIWPTPEEAEAIRAGIDADPDAFELDEEWFAKARPAIEVVPELVIAAREGRIKIKPFRKKKERVTIRLDADVVAHFRAGGKGWQTRLNSALREAVFGS